RGGACPPPGAHAAAGPRGGGGRGAPPAGAALARSTPPLDSRDPAAGPSRRAGRLVRAPLVCLGHDLRQPLADAAEGGQAADVLPQLAVGEAGVLRVLHALPLLLRPPGDGGELVGVLLQLLLGQSLLHGSLAPLISGVSVPLPPAPHAAAVSARHRRPSPSRRFSRRAARRPARRASRGASASSHEIRGWR